jgi:hypothetical protein
MHGSESHKKVDKSLGLLHLYYTNRNVLGLVCLSAELVYVCLYVRVFAAGALLGHVAGYPVHVVDAVLAASVPLWALKQYLNIKQLVNALLSMDVVAAAPAPLVAASSGFSLRVTSPDGKVPAAIAARPVTPTPAAVQTPTAAKATTPRRGRAGSRTPVRGRSRSTTKTD